MVSARYAGILAVLSATAYQASGFGLGIGAVSRSADVVRPIRTTVTSTSMCNRGCDCGRATVSVGFSTPAEAGGMWGAGRWLNQRTESRRGCALMMSRSNRGVSQSTQFNDFMNPDVSEDLPVCEMSDDPLLKEVLTVCKAADERKADNIVAIRVAPLTAVTEYMVVLEGNSRPQNQAISQNIEEKMEENHKRVPTTQGSPESGWILLDYGDIIVHIMTPKSRSYYDLESFWSNGTPVPLDNVLTPNVVTKEEPVEEEVDPFWS